MPLVKIRVTVLGLQNRSNNFVLTAPFCESNHFEAHIKDQYKELLINGIGRYLF